MWKIIAIVGGGLAVLATTSVVSYKLGVRSAAKPAA